MLISCDQSTLPKALIPEQAPVQPTESSFMAPAPTVDLSTAIAPAPQFESVAGVAMPIATAPLPTF